MMDDELSAPDVVQRGREPPVLVGESQPADSHDETLRQPVVVMSNVESPLARALATFLERRGCSIAVKPVSHWSGGREGATPRLVILMVNVERIEEVTEALDSLERDASLSRVPVLAVTSATSALSDVRLLSPQTGLLTSMTLSDVLTDILGLPLFENASEVPADDH